MNNFSMNLRRYRQNASIRNLFSTVELKKSNLIQPYFIYESISRETPLTAIFGQKKHTLTSLQKEIEWSLKNKVSSILLFIIPKKKSHNHFDYSFDKKVITSLKNTFGNDLVLFLDVCLCSNTISGHCGIINQYNNINNELSVKEITNKSLSYAQAGADVLSPSDMMDGRILSIRKTLDENNFHSKLIMSYSTKFSSNFYGPFRDAAQSTPEIGDRKTYQIDPRNPYDAIQSSIRDKEEGADILMVKPAGNYLDIIYQIKSHPKTKETPLCAYQVSGEYKSLELMNNAGHLDFKMAYKESLFAISRAGADLIITYGATEFAASSN